jgi:hypothetical protein
MTNIPSKAKKNGNNTSQSNQHKNKQSEGGELEGG